ncbi:hypothetical protein NDU88_006296 [Pleurodeles waltl]|uniref:Uncharacterized protein n=1 Tax=Pleurodeles waltl TaxID=8319 RepID=A0AAV7WA69_PLEWA|nr:hypothetical protein NDU88_006296 [Pleurodeles waltl]
MGHAQGATSEKLKLAEPHLIRTRPPNSTSQPGTRKTQRSSPPGPPEIHTQGPFMSESRVNAQPGEQEAAERSNALKSEKRNKGGKKTTRTRSHPRETKAFQVKLAEPHPKHTNLPAKLHQSTRGQKDAAIVAPGPPETHIQKDTQPITRCPGCA